MKWLDEDYPGQTITVDICVCAYNIRSFVYHAEQFIELVLKKKLQFFLSLFFFCWDKIHGRNRQWPDSYKISVVLGFKSSPRYLNDSIRTTLCPFRYICKGRKSQRAAAGPHRNQKKKRRHREREEREAERDYSQRRAGVRQTRARSAHPESAWGVNVQLCHI